MNKDNLKLYSRATWEVLIKDPALSIWGSRKEILFGLGVIAAIGLAEYFIWQLSWSVARWLAVSLDIRPADVEYSSAGTQPLFFIVGSIMAIGVVAGIVVSLLSITDAIEAKVQNWKPKQVSKPRRKRKAAAE